MKRICILILCAALMLCGCAPKQPPAPTTTAPAPTQPPQTIPAATEPGLPTGIGVETPCGTVYLPDNWDEPITVETTLGEPMILSFFAGETALYDLTFFETPSDAIGVVRTADGPIYVGMTLHPMEVQNDMLLSMQESVNELLAQLAPEPVDIQPPAEQPLLIPTEFGQMTFPGKWEDMLLTDRSEEDTLDFYCLLPDRDPVLIFTAVFGTAEGGISAVITSDAGIQTSLIFLTHELTFGDGWSVEETDLVYAMQEDLNFLLDDLMN